MIGNVKCELNLFVKTFSRVASGNSEFSTERWVREKIRQNDGCRYFASKVGDEFGKTQSPLHTSLRTDRPTGPRSVMIMEYCRASSSPPPSRFFLLSLPSLPPPPVGTSPLLLLHPFPPNANAVSEREIPPLIDIMMPRPLLRWINGL